MLLQLQTAGVYHNKNSLTIPIEMKESYEFHVQKGLILCGDPCTGKSLIAKFIGELLPKRLEINGRTKNVFDDPFVFSGLTEEHKAILIDDVQDIELLAQTFSIMSNDSIVVRRHGKPSIYIPSPRVIVTTEMSIESLMADPRVMRRYHIVELKGCNYSQGQ